ncbi:ATP synthase membrane subunit K, mitochondrial-like [Myotis daubentonii]|uniref:ATP synthase membrane subunit K, mitochondrial-like n=1 Tax=Myotis daubentonii TaxID=98922 RepID=UPI002872CB4B|nr:ATP synthase membrane subunit K, mitochondrial-like [Myotis daubentonii]
MAGPEADAQFQFTGIKKYFNSYTLTGRMNCVMATYGGIALLILYFKLRSKKTPAVAETECDHWLLGPFEVPATAKLLIAGHFPFPSVSSPPLSSAYHCESPR